MKTRTILNVTIKVHNKREDRLLNLIQQYIDDCIDCKNDGLNHTSAWYLEEINGMFTALYFLKCIKEHVTFSFDDLLNLYISFN